MIPPWDPPPYWSACISIHPLGPDGKSYLSTRARQAAALHDWIAMHVSLLERSGSERLDVVVEVEL